MEASGSREYKAPITPWLTRNSAQDCLRINSMKETFTPKRTIYFRKLGRSWSRALTAAEQHGRAPLRIWCLQQLVISKVVGCV